MAVNKVCYGDRTLVDMTDATATAETILAGYTAYGADGQLITGAAKSARLAEQTITLPASGWSGRRQTVAVPGVTADCVVFIAADLAEANRYEYEDCGIWCSGQGAGTLTFECAYVPATDLAVSVAIFA